MTGIIALFLVLTFMLLLAYGVLAFLAWQKISVFLTWNTRYTSNEYETAVTSTKPKLPFHPPAKTEQKGRAIKPVDDLVDLDEIPFEDAVTAIESMGEGNGA